MRFHAGPMRLSVQLVHEAQGLRVPLIAWIELCSNTKHLAENSWVFLTTSQANDWNNVFRPAWSNQLNLSTFILRFLFSELFSRSCQPFFTTIIFNIIDRLLIP